MAGFLRWRNCRGEDRRKNLHRGKSSPPKKRDLPVAPPLSSRSVAAKSDAIIWLAGFGPKRHRVCPGFLPLLCELYPKLHGIAAICQAFAFGQVPAGLTPGKDFGFDSIANGELVSGSVI